MYKGQMYTVVFDEKPTQKEAMQAMAAELDKIKSKKYHLTFAEAAQQYTEIKWIKVQIIAVVRVTQHQAKAIRAAHQVQLNRLHRWKLA